MVFTKYEELPLVLSVEEMAKVLKIGRNTAYEMVRCRRVKSVRIGRQIRIPKESVRTLITGA